MLSIWLANSGGNSGWVALSPGVGLSEVFFSEKSAVCSGSKGSVEAAIVDWMTVSDSAGCMSRRWFSSANVLDDSGIVWGNNCNKLTIKSATNSLPSASGNSIACASTNVLRFVVVVSPSSSSPANLSSQFTMKSIGLDS